MITDGSDRMVKRSDPIRLSEGPDMDALNERWAATTRAVVEAKRFAQAEANATALRPMLQPLHESIEGLRESQERSDRRVTLLTFVIIALTAISIGVTLLQLALSHSV